MIVPKIGFAPRLAALYAAMFGMLGIQLPFFPLWLKAKGFDAQMIGVALAIPTILRIFAISFAARTADRHDALRAAIVVASCASLAGYVATGLMAGAVSIMVAYGLASLAFTPILPLTETYALRGLGARGQSYGPVRLWGSVAFIAGSFIAGYATDVLPARALIWLIVAGLVLLALAAWSLAPLTPSAASAVEHTASRKSPLRDPAFVAVLTAASLIQASHAVYYGFSALAWHAKGLDGTAIAALWALGVVAEIVLFALSGRLPPFFTPVVLMLIGAGGAVLRWTVMAFDPPVALLLLLQPLHALSFGATFFGSLNFIARRAPPGQSATAQGYLAIASGAAMAAAMGVSGLLYAAFGSLSYASMALMALAGGACAFVAYQSGRPVAR